MHCRTCNYPLWNLRARTCPECGAPFAPSDFEYVPNSVRFCCPHCDHPYLGAGAKGHLEPGHFQCLRCTHPVTIDEMVLRPGLGVEEKLTLPDTMPWLDRRARGRVRAWFQMIGKAISSPGQLIAATPPDSPLRQAWVFAVATTAVLLVAEDVIVAALCLAQGEGIGWLFDPWISPRDLPIPELLVTFLPGRIALALLLLWVWTLFAHAVLRLTGGTAFPYRRTCQALLYSAGAYLLCAASGWGVYAGAAWWAVSAALMLKRGQRVNSARAGLAAGALPALAVISVLNWSQVSRLWSSPQTTPWSLTLDAPTYQTSIVNVAVVSYASGHSGACPGHAIELALADRPNFSGVLPGPLFCNPGTKTTAAHVPLGDGTLDDFSTAGRSEQLLIVARVLRDVPSGVIAHRLGDFIFTYHGAPVATHDAQLWLVVMLPDPDANGPPRPRDAVFIGTLDYQVTQSTVAQLPALLAAQNSYRATLRMPPLPDLTTVTHDHPAVAPP